MLEGLEAVEINLSEVETGIRIDAELYKKEIVLFEKKINKIKHTFLGKEAFLIKKGIFDIKASCYLDKGIPFVRISNLKNCVIATDEIVYIPEEQNIKNNDTYLLKGDIILSKTAYAAASIVDIPFCNVSQDTVAIKLKPNSQLNSHFTVVYLNTRYGLKQMQRRFTGNIQMHLNLDDCKNNLQIPIFSSKFQNSIKELFYSAIIKKNLSKSNYQQAETLLLEALGLQDFEPSNEPVNVKNFSESFLASGRLDAEYYQRKYEEIENALKRNSNGFTFVKKEFGLSKDIIDKTEKTYNYTEISDVNTSDGTVSYNEIEVTELPDNGKMKLKKGQLIISKVRPYRGAVAIIRDEPKNYVGSGAFTVLEEKGNIKKEVLQVLLRTKPCQELIMKYNVGSTYPVVKDEDILNLPIPNIDKDIQHQIAEKIQESFRLKRESERLLELAKRAVEVAIEEGEEAGIEMMSSFAKASGDGE